MYNPNPEEELMRKTGAVESPLTISEQELYKWYSESHIMREEKSRRRMFEDMHEFSDVYPPDKLTHDKQEVIKKRQRPKEGDVAQKAELLELILSRFSDRAQWFGQMVAYRTLEFDDRIHGVDMVLEGKEENGNPIYIAIDCTVAQSQEKIDEKVDGITKNIENDTLSTVEYFQSDDGEVKGKIECIPKVIIAVNPERMDNLCQDVIPAVGSEKGKYDRLSNSHFQIFFLRQIESQLEKQRQLVRLPKEDMRMHKKEVAEAIENALKYIQKILREKEKSLDQSLIQRGNMEFEDSGLRSTLAA
jgi:hypothetical protein